MLILTRRTGETIEIGLEDGRILTVTTLGVKGNQVRYGIAAPKSIRVDRSEIAKRKRGESENDYDEIDGNVGTREVAPPVPEVPAAPQAPTITLKRRRCVDSLEHRRELEGLR